MTTPSSNPFAAVRFLTSAAKLSQAPPDSGYELAFAGRSNAGKSSAINTICRQKQLARTSKTPGRTQLLNFFQLDDERRLVDLPGYGYARVSEKTKRTWQHSMEDYLVQRDCLRALVVLMDIRHPLMPLDRQLIDWAILHGRDLHLVLTKADKLKPKGAAAVLLETERAVKASHSEISFQTFSALKGYGLEEIRQRLAELLAIPEISQ